MAGKLNHEVMIIGGGFAGIATASSMLKRRPSLDIAIVDAGEDRYYQPGWTMVGGGILDAPVSGFVDIDKFTVQHVRYPNVFEVCDAGSTPNAKTAAAARKQAAIIAVNALAVLNAKQPVADYHGYRSCPLRVERGKIVLVEFSYDGKLLPSFPEWVIDGARPRKLSWLLKSEALPWIYWNGMLKGHEWLVKPQVKKAA